MSCTYANELFKKTKKDKVDQLDLQTKATKRNMKGPLRPGIVQLCCGAACLVVPLLLLCQPFDVFGEVLLDKVVNYPGPLGPLAHSARAAAMVADERGSSFAAAAADAALYAKSHGSWSAVCLGMG